MSPVLKKTVLVLGAGFTYAFVPEAPLLRSDFGGKVLAEEFQGFQYATRVLDAEVRRFAGGEMDIERLMTRLDSRMPYDSPQNAQEELALLLAKLKMNFARRITNARDKAFPNDDLAHLAAHCVENGITCITFNYDDIFDQALTEANTGYGNPACRYWHPDGGYGFTCKASYDTVEATQMSMDETSMLLLKLHGSVNWRGRRGAPQPYGLEDILHHERWLRTPLDRTSLFEKIEPRLDPEPLIVPPVLVKSSLVEEQILQLVWLQAYEELAEAERVIFVGYSFPVTDLAATFLFTETLFRDEPHPLIEVVNFASTGEEETTVMEDYRKVFPRIDDGQFYFKGARDWSHEFVDTASGSEAVSG